MSHFKITAMRPSTAAFCILCCAGPALPVNQTAREAPMVMTVQMFEAIGASPTLSVFEVVVHRRQ